MNILNRTKEYLNNNGIFETNIFKLMYELNGQNLEFKNWQFSIPPPTYEDLVNVVEDKNWDEIKSATIEVVDVFPMDNIGNTLIKNGVFYYRDNYKNLKDNTPNKKYVQLKSVINSYGIPISLCGNVPCFELKKNDILYFPTNDIINLFINFLSQVSDTFTFSLKYSVAKNGQIFNETTKNLNVLVENNTLEKIKINEWGVVCFSLKRTDDSPNGLWVTLISKN